MRRIITALLIAVLAGPAWGALTKPWGAVQPAGIFEIDSVAVGDGSTDDTAALQAACDSGASFIRLSYAGKTYKITDTVTCPANMSMDFGTSKILYAGTHDRPAFVHGANGSTNTCNIQNLWIESDSIDWSTDYVGFKAINMSRAKVHVRRISGFKIDYWAYSNGQGYTLTTHNLIDLHDSEYALALTADDTSSYVTENVFIGGDFTNNSSTDALGNCYSIYFNALNGGYTAHNNNRFYGPSFQPGNGQAGDTRVAVRFDGVGRENYFWDARYESGRGAVMIVSGPAGDGSASTTVVANNRMTLGFFGGSYTSKAVQQSGSARLNFVETLRDNYTTDRVVFQDLVHKVKSYSSGNSAISGGLHLSAVAGSTGLLSTADISGSTPLISTLENSVELNGRALGFFVEINGGESFKVIAETEAGYPGRFFVNAYDSDFTLLDAGSATYPDIINGFTGTYNTWNGSTGYGAQSDGGDFTFSTSASVKYLRISITSGTAPARVTAIGLERLTKAAEPMRVFSGIDYDGRYQYTTTNATGNSGVFARGDMLMNVAAGSGVPSYWQCTTAGRFAPAWVAAAAYTVGQMVLNDTNKIYICVTAGTSAGSGGPTGTGSAIADNTATWNYFGPLAVLSAGANL